MYHESFSPDGNDLTAFVIVAKGHHDWHDHLSSVGLVKSAEYVIAILRPSSRATIGEMGHSEMLIWQALSVTNVLDAVRLSIGLQKACVIKSV
jgi:hypothetical protein